MSIIREIQKSFTRSKGWRKVRNNHVKENSFCACCGKTKNLEVHHKQPFHEHPELELEPSNLITLCRGSLNCHIFIGHLGDWKSYNLGVERDSDYLNLKIRNRP